MNGLPINSLVEALGWMLLHFVWQGTAIAAALWCLLRLVQNSSAQLRYGAACAALLLMLATGLATFVWAFDVPKVPAQKLTSTPAALDVAPTVRELSSLTINTPVALPTHREAADQSLRPTTAASATGVSALAGVLRPWLPWIVSLWVIGVAIHSLRFYLGWRSIRGLRAAGRELEDAVWIERFDCLRKRLGVSSGVRLLASATATVPMVIGCLKPVVLVPASLLTGLSTSQVEAILMHELTHIRRHDYLVNLLQNMVETLFFYHPALWWVSAQVRQERENCCDDVASAYCGNSVEYARALTALEELRSVPPVSIVAASGGSLLDRIRRLGVHQPAPSRALWPVPVLAVLMLLAVALPLTVIRATEPATTATEAAQQEPDEKKPEAEKSASTTETEEPGTDRKVLLVTGKVVDAETGKPVTPFIIQGGKFDPADPTQVTWGFSERTQNSADGTLNCGINLNWSEGWTARILADGYLPHPLVHAGIPSDQKSLDVTIRLQRGRLVRGQVLDHTGQPVSGAAVAALRPTPINLYGGKVHNLHDEVAKLFGDDVPMIRDTVKSVQTDDGGRFELHMGAVDRLGITHESLDAWTTPVPKEGDAVVRLPAPARIEIAYDIPGDDTEGKVLLQLLSQYMPGFEKLESTRAIAITNGDRLVLSGITPGKYMVYRKKSHRIGRSGTGVNLDREYFEVKPGETKTVDYEREHGARLRGQINWPEDVQLEAVIIKVQSEKLDWDPFSENELTDGSRAFIQPREARAFQITDADGNFLTERVLPGRYRLVVEGYTLTDDPKGTLAGALGVIGPYTVVGYRAETIVEVPQSGELVVPDLMLLDVASPQAAIRAIETTTATAEAAEREAAEEKSEESAAATEAKEPGTDRKVLQVTGKVVDAETGEPVTRFMIQPGNFDPVDPAQVTWGFGERTENSADGSFICGLNLSWSEGWTARVVLADGYLPHPIVPEGIPADQKSLEVTIRLQPGRLVRGQVLDHNGRPVSGAAVAALRPKTHINMYGGKANNYHDELVKTLGDIGNIPIMGDTVKSVQTDDDGRFELPVGGVERLGISHESLDAWPVPVPKEGDVVVRLPAPARIEIAYDIPGGDAEANIFLQMLSHHMPGFEELRSTRAITIKNGDRLILPGITPGKYEVSRKKTLRIGSSGKGINLDREYFEVKPGESKTIDYDREQGARLRGRVTLPEGIRAQVVTIKVQSEELVWDPFRKDEMSEDVRAFIQYNEARAFQIADADGNFLTERVLPGRYRLLAEGYIQIDVPTPSPFQGGFLGPRPAYRAETIVEVPDSGELVVPDLMMKTAE